ncbi:putative nucleotidyltransferase with HDIG domain [Methanolinea mesophila]|uniref:HDIG domain-containing metalloprotein n=1 Tax=Methanolinea mesophila TaxID=547055 RepID=UPI001AEBA2E9|nr:HDIG domain-containing metalloprotein [Methanolinea mesophila]MBP1927508.1 putative nucleotidyltransferase with HDIG domain [Methanolinea mesophila]
MERRLALELLSRYVHKESLYRHCIATAAVMRETAAYLGQDQEEWETIGILHDIDFESIDEDMQRHGVEGYRILKEEGFDERIALPVRNHNDLLFGVSDEPVDRVLQAADNVSGLVIACALVKGGKISEVTTKSIQKKFKEKSFAAGCRREMVRRIEPLMDLPTFFGLALKGLTGVKDELGLE